MSSETLRVSALDGLDCLQDLDEFGALYLILALSWLRCSSSLK